MKEDFSRLISFHPVNDLMHNTTVVILLIVNFKSCLDVSKRAANQTTNMWTNDILNVPSTGLKMSVLLEYFVIVDIAVTHSQEIT